MRTRIVQSSKDGRTPFVVKMSDHTVFGGKSVYVELSLIETISPSQASNGIVDRKSILGVGKLETCTLLFVKLF